MSQHQQYCMILVDSPLHGEPYLSTPIHKCSNGRGLNLLRLDTIGAGQARHNLGNGASYVNPRRSWSKHDMTNFI
jgi:hypothetical protein